MKRPTESLHSCFGYKDVLLSWGPIFPDHQIITSAWTQDEVPARAWAAIREPLELQLAPLGRHALRALAPRPGESALDIGCGGGETALDLARAVAPDGMVVGIDLSAAVLAFATRLAKGCKRIRFV